MNKKYLKWQLKQWIPLTIVTFFIMIIPFFITYLASFSSFSSAMFMITTNYQGDIVYPITTPWLFISIPAGVMSLVIPVFVCQYRYKRKSADLFLQAPFQTGGMLRNRSLLGLAILDVDFTAAYWVAYIMVYVKQAVLNGNASYLRYYNLEEYIKNNGAYYYNFGAVAACFFVGLILLSLIYYVNVYIASLGTNQLSGILFLLLASCVLTMGFFPYSYYLCSVDAISSENIIFPIASWSAVNFVSSPFVWFREAICTGTYSLLISTLSTTQIVMFFVNNVIFIALGVVAAVFVNKGLKESGEEMGQPVSTMLFPRLIIHIFFFTIAVLDAVSFGSLSFVFTGVTTVGAILSFALYSYLGIALITKRFKLTKLDWILWGVNIAVLTILSVASLIVQANLTITIS